MTTPNKPLTLEDFDNLSRMLDSMTQHELDAISIASAQAYLDAGGTMPDLTGLMPPTCGKCQPMSKLVQPKTFMIGATSIDSIKLEEYLKYTRQTDFLNTVTEARNSGLNDADILCSFYAKLCYASLVEGRNDNLTSTRSIQNNVSATLANGHGSVFEHVWVNFVTTDCSRVFTHELVRHRVGTAFSQTSGRYVRADNINMVWDPILDPIGPDVVDLLETIEIRYNQMVQKMLPANGKSTFDERKKITSALRRILPNGQSNEMGWSINLRAARHLIMLRTSHYAEWEIRTVFAQVYELMKQKYPLMFADAKVRIIDGLPEVYGMKTQPYEEAIVDRS